MGLFKLSVVVLIGVFAAVLYTVFNEEDVPIPKHVDKWWGLGEPADESKEKPRRFQINFPQKDLDELNSRLEKTRFSSSLEGVNFEYGTNPEFLKIFVRIWKAQYNWREQEKRINAFPQYLMKISGIDVHYIHVKPEKSSKKRVIPLLISHGWPGSVVEFLNAIPLLMKPNPEEDFTFEIICPHIPGYGFSEAPKKPGFNHVEAAHIYAKLMSRLGHSKYYVQGGDWGSITLSSLAALYPDRVIGLHLNMAPYLLTSSNMARYVLGSIIPSIAPGAEVGSPQIYPISKFMSKVIGASGYFHLQATFPDSLGAALTDTPAGLAAYILDKFAYGTDMETAAGKFDGGLKKLNREDLITNLMVYWISNSITSSIRFYKENMQPALRKQKVDKIKVTVPTGFLLCEREPLLGTTMLGWNRYKNITFWEKRSECGHFAAMEDPSGFANSVRKFVLKLES